MAKRFYRMRECFTCRICGVATVGNGYTNHCPACLWSRHVDVNPGDRAESCGGLMKPISVEQKGGRYRIEHACARCGARRYNKVSKKDDFDAVIALVQTRNG